MILLFGIIAAALIGLLQYRSQRRSLGELEIGHRFSVSAAEPDEPFEVILSFRNHSKTFLPYLRFGQSLPRGLTPQVDSWYVNPDYRGGCSVIGSTWLQPRQQLLRRIPVSGTGRGLYRMGDLRLFNGDFMGLRETAYRYKELAEVVIYPREAPLGDLDAILGGMLGDISVRRFLFEDPVLTLGYREYSGREPMKNISWTQSARAGELMVKNFDHTTEPSVSVVLNVACSARDREELIERCCSVTRAVTRLLEDKGVPYDLTTNAFLQGSMSRECHIVSGLGSRHFHSVLECLGRVSYNAGDTCAELLGQVLKNAGAGHGVILITPERPEETDPVLRAAGAGCTLTTIAARELD